MSKGADPKANDNAALLLAIKLQHDNQIEWLAANGAILNTDEQDLSPLDVVTDVRTLKLLERRGLVLDSKATSMTSLALNNAVYYGNVDMVEYLLMKGASFNCDGEFAHKLAEEMLVKGMPETLLPRTVLPPELQSRANIVELLQKKMGKATRANILFVPKKILASYDVTEWDHASLREVQAAAELGKPSAQFVLGGYYYSGVNGVHKDAAQALELYKLAAAAKFLPAINELGYMYDVGEGGLALDPVEAARHYKLAADLGYSKSQYNLGLRYRDGVGVPQDLSEAARLFLLAAIQGHDRAQTQLSNIEYENENHSEAFYWAEKAAKQGNEHGLYHMAKYTYAGLGTKKDDKLARQMFAKLLSSKDEHVKTHAQEQLDMMRAEKTMKMREVFKPAVELPKCSIDGAPSSASCEACKKPACSSHMSSQAGVLLCSSCHGCSFDLKPMPDNNSGKCDRCKQLVCVNHCTGTGGGGAVCFACEPPVKQVGKTVNVEGFVSAKQLKGKDKEREQQLKEEAKSEKQSKIASEIEAAKEKAKSLAEKAAEREAVRAAKAAEKYGGKKGKKGGK